MWRNVNMEKTIQLQNLVRKLKAENEQRAIDMNSGNISDYNHTVKVHTYNNTLEIIKQIEGIIGTVNY
jgi:hypothetical protein